MSSVNLSQIHPRAFAHPADQKATAAFGELPVLPELLKKISELSLEERWRAHHMNNSILIGPRQLPSIWGIVEEVSRRLCIPPPTTYVTRDHGLNAFTFGKHSHCILLTSGLVDLMSDEELRGIIAHEMGHILCEHLLYMDVGLALTLRSGAVSTLAKYLPFVEESALALFYSWFRAAEYSADRAALLILEDEKPLARSLCRLAGVPARFEGEFDINLFVDQAKTYKKQATWWSKVVTFGMGAFLTHPEPAKRVGALFEWSKSEQYQSILEGRYLTRFEAETEGEVLIPGVKYCPLCRTVVGMAPSCPKCKLPQNPLQQQKCLGGHVNSINWKFCKACGKNLKSGATSTEIPGC